MTSESTSQRTEGQAIPPHYSLVRRLSDTSDHDCWLALDESTNDRVFLRFIGGVTEASWQALEAGVSRARGLVHNNIARVLYVSPWGEQPFIAEPYFRDAEHFSVDGKTANELWHQLSTLIEVVSYAHQLGVAHGHLHPGNVIIDQSGRLHVTGYGLPTNIASGSDGAVFFSPEARSGAAPDLSDDLYSLGAFVFWSLTQKHYHPGVEVNTPMPREVDTLVHKMLSEASYDRQVELTDLVSALEGHYEGRSNTIQSVGFSRQASGPVETTPTGTTGTDSTQVVLSRGQTQVSMPMVLGGLGVLVLLVIMVFVFLPGESGPTALPEVAEPAPVQSTSTPAPAETAAPATGPSPFEQARLDHAREEGEKIAREILRHQIELEDMGANLWARDELEAVALAINEAEEAFRNNDFENALALYEGLRQELIDLKAQAETVLAENIAAGEAAIAAADPVAAMTAFSIATSIKPGDAELAASLLRAENLGEVLSLVNRGEMQEREGNLDDSLALFRQAATMDAKWQPASSGVARLTAAIEQRRFNDAMSRGFAALAGKDYEAARRSFESASSIFPDSNEPEDGMLQIEQAEQRDQITLLRTAAETAMSQDSWQTAIVEYNAALAIDPSLVFAREGLNNAEHRLKVETDLKELLADPAQLQDDEILGHARKTLSAASRVEPKSDTTMDYINALAKLISSARIELPLLIHSDNRTEVTVYRIGHLGKIQSHQLNLIPGRYTIIGKRSGYRDVRRDITLLSGEPVPPVAVICDERI